MKYNDQNKPLVCMMTQSTCYRKTGRMQIKGVLWHDTGANNPTLKRYVQPDDNAADREHLLSLLGKNKYGNDHNHKEGSVGLNYWVGKLADGTVTTVQTMPDDYRPWGCGSGAKGSCNSGWIQFEICEDGKDDPVYLEAAYREACELTAYLCKKYGIDPHGTANCNGVTVPTILCHQDAHKLGLGSNHGDIYDWFPKYGKNMTTARDDVARLMMEDIQYEVIGAEESTDSQEIAGKDNQDNGQENMQDRTEPSATDEAVYADLQGTDNATAMWSYLFGKLGNAYAVAGIMGNLQAESGLRPNNLQNAYEKSLNMSDAEYTAAVDSGTYDNFVRDHAGYGLAQWTYWSRKEALLNFVKNAGRSIGDLQGQLDFLWKELSEIEKGLTDTLKQVTSVREASDLILTRYERPANQDAAVREKRAQYGQTFFDRFVTAVQASASSTMPVQASAPSTKYYRVRKTWADRSSQIGAFTVFQNAVNQVNMNPGYAAFDENGNQVYPIPAVLPYQVRITNKALNYRTGPAKTFRSYGYIKPGTYRIVDEKDGWGLLEAYAEHKNGWVCLDYVTRI